MLFRSICITCDRITELKLAVFSHECYVPKNFCCGIDAKLPDSMTLHSVLADVLPPTELSSMLDCSRLARVRSDLSCLSFLSPIWLPSCATDLCFTYICKLSCILYDVSNGHDRIPILDWFDRAYIFQFSPDYQIFVLLPDNHL